MKSLTLIIITLLLSNFGMSQNSTEAKALLDQVSKKVKAYENIAIDFKYVLTNEEEGINQETRGNVIMQGEKYILNILGITRIFNGTTLYSISPEDEEVTISTENTEDDSTITPSKMLSFYENDYNYAMDIVQNVQGRKVQYVKLTPIDSNSEIKQVLLGIDSKTKHIYNLIEIGNNNTKTTLTVNSFKTNEPLSKTLFTFDEEKYKDYYINKLD
ncbi:outer membrane lipoprotein carrier protein LolA [Flavobacteriaceae bacterium AU392]|nr:outer membrane lipoprotein carrier protein LolA [Flavobacteriaceae bacterium]RKM86546.1 outer membrane lipoprotein carrier protein LolA [Flavobacteriaceae bacterium AU392]